MNIGKDGTVIGTLTDDILNRRIIIATGEHRQDKTFRNLAGTVGQFLELLTTFERRAQKDGRCILQGELAGGQRIAKNVIRNYLMIVDIDTGMSVEETGTILVEKGLFGIIWTTHSFGKSTTEISEEHFLRWCKRKGRAVPTGNDELAWDLGLYLKEEKRYQPAVFETFSYEGRKLVEGGMKYIVHHAPMPKLRVLFLLKEPFDFTTGTSQKTRIEEWKQHYAAVSEWLGLPYDSSCVDPSRLMYTPRIPVGAPVGEGQHECLVFGGKALDLDEVPKVSSVSGDAISNLLAAAGDTEDEGERHVFKTPGLLEFVKKCPDFDIIGFMEANGPDDRRSEGDGDKSEWACPNEDSHTEQRADDRAFFVTTNGETWYCGCMHDGCKHASKGDRLWYVDLLCQKYGIKHASELEAWSASAQQKQVEASQAVQDATAGNHEALIEKLTPESSVKEIEAVLKILAMVESPLEQDAAIGLIKKNTKGKLAVPAMRKAIEAHAIAMRAALTSPEPEPEPVDPRAPEPEDPTAATEIWDHWSFDKKFYVLRHLLQKENEREPRLFKTEDGRLVYVLSTDMGAKIVDAQLNVVTWHTIGRIKYKYMDRLTGEVTEERVPKDLIDTLLGDLERDWPTLLRISNTPIVMKDGTQAYKRGYIPELKLFLDPPAEFLPLPDVITDAHVDEAYNTIVDTIRDFPFCDYSEKDASQPIQTESLDEDGHPYPNLDRGRSSRANAIAMIIEPFARHLIDGAAPMYFIDKPAPGSGAGYLADVAFLVAQGTRAVAQTMSDNNEEFRKAITAVLREGSSIVFVDNVNRKVDSGPLAAAITNGTWQDRILGESTVTRIKITNTWMIAGNNVKFTPENMRRLVPMKLDARVPNPAFDRPKAAFKHNPLQDYVLKNRARIVQAINVLIKHWVDKGMPRSDLTFNSFDNWVAVMGGILEAAGVTGFLDNLRDFNSVKNVDDDSKNEYGRLMFERYKFSHFTKMEALIALKGNGFGDTIELPIKADKDDGITATNLRAWMADHMDGNVFYLDPEKTQTVVLNTHRTSRDRTGWQFTAVTGFKDTPEGT